MNATVYLAPVIVAAVIFFIVAVVRAYQQASPRARSRRPGAKGDAEPRWKGLAEGFKKVIGLEKSKSLVEWIRQDEAQILIGFFGYFTCNVFVWMIPSWWALWGWSGWFWAGWFLIAAVSILWASTKNGKTWAVSALIIYHIGVSMYLSEQAHRYSRHAPTGAVEQSAEEEVAADDGVIVVPITDYAVPYDLPPGEVVTFAFKSNYEFGPETAISDGCFAKWPDQRETDAIVVCFGNYEPNEDYWVFEGPMPAVTPDERVDAVAQLNYLALSDGMWFKIQLVPQ
jgi:hypothetical protein